MGPGMAHDSWHITGCEVVVIQAQNNLFRIPCAAFAWSIQENSNGKCYRFLHRYKTRVYTETRAVSETGEESRSSCLKRHSSTAIISPKPKPFQKRESQTSAHHHILRQESAVPTSWTVLLWPEWVGLQEVKLKRLPIKVFCDFRVAWAHALQKHCQTLLFEMLFSPTKKHLHENPFREMLFPPT